MPLHKFIDAVNLELCKLFKNVKVYGIAQTVTKRRGQSSESFPGVLQGTEIREVGVDDRYALVLYHKITGISTLRTQTNQGYGDSVLVTNTYSLSIIGYLDTRKTKMTADEAFLYVQENIPFQLKGEPYRQILLRVTNVILNVEQIFNAEYKGIDFKLPVEKTLFQINYTIESTHNKGCFEKCPEDC